MTFEEFKRSILDVTSVTTDLEYKLAVFWLHHEHLPVGIVGLNSLNAIVRIPKRYKNT